MSKEKIEEGLISPILEVRKAFAESEDVFDSLNEYQIERGLTDDKPIIRYIFAKNCMESFDVVLTSEQFKRGLMDKNKSVQALFIKNDRGFIQGNSITDLLKGKYAEVKIAIASNGFISLTNDQRKDMIISPIKKVRNEIVKRLLESKFINNNKFLLSDSHKEVSSSFLRLHPILTNYELESGFIDSASSVRLACIHTYTYSINKSKYKVSHEQIERGLTDENNSVRYAWAEMVSENKLSLTERQINRGLRDISSDVRSSFADNKHITLTEEQVNIVLKDSSSSVIAGFLTRDDINLTEEQKKMCVNSEDENLRAAIAVNSSIP